MQQELAPSRTILSFDPGKVNMGFAVIRQRGLKVKVLKRGMLKHTVKDLKPNDLKPTVLKFNQEVEVIIDRYHVTEIVMERFVSRGLLGSLSEYICIMQGILSINPKITRFNLIIPSTWKNNFNRVYNLKLLYKQASKAKIKPHELDAVLIGLYYLDSHYYQRFQQPKARDRFMQKLATR